MTESFDEKRSSTKFPIRKLLLLGTLTLSAACALFIAYKINNQEKKNIPGVLPKQEEASKKIIPNLFKNNDSKKVAHIKINGVLSSEYYSDGINSLIEKAREDNIKAYLFEISSPGGTVLPSKEISDKINEVEKGLDGKKGTEDDVYTIAWIRSIGASGAYWVASAADVIVADEMSIVGSIGVFINYLTIEELLDNLGIKNEEIKAGKNKNTGSMYRDTTPEERGQLQQHINKVYKFFIKSVAENRNMGYNEVESLATGDIFLGIEALEKGLIDKLGGKNEVVGLLKEKLGNFEIKVYSPGYSWSDQMEIFGEAVGKGVGKTILEEHNESNPRPQLKRKTF